MGEQGTQGALYQIKYVQWTMLEDDLSLATHLKCPLHSSVAPLPSLVWDKRSFLSRRSAPQPGSCALPHLLL